ncbi:hypothetical protein LCGC14_2931070 [marine sediment metagenome]|uniref:Uncharacterized protein n=1 Tax=marine sediment metagenome TaxID=412755 RepID=A0A0F8ZTK3_9ZZZZ
MLLTATPEQKVPGVPPMAVLRRSGQLGSLDIDWGDVITTGVQAGSGLLTTRYGVPQLQRGTMIQEGPGGQRILLAQPAGVPVQTPMPASTRTQIDTSWGTGLLMAGAAVMVVLVVVMTKGGAGRSK